MAVRPHRAHGYRVVSRCVWCGRSLLGACRYKTCAATVILNGGTKHTCKPSRRADTRRRIDWTREARRIFGDDIIAPATEIGL